MMMVQKRIPRYEMNIKKRVCFSERYHVMCKYGVCVCVHICCFISRASVSNKTSKREKEQEEFSVLTAYFYFYLMYMYERERTETTTKEK
jgi:hypothetical protein